MDLNPPSKAALRDAGYALVEVGLAERTRPLLWEKAKAYALKEYTEAPRRLTTKKAIWVTDEVPLAIKWYLDKGGGYKGLDESTLLSRLLSMLPKAGILGDSEKSKSSIKVKVLSKVVYLSPAWESGMVMCPHFGICGKTCIGHSSGRMPGSVQRRNRLVKTLLWKLYPKFFLQKLQAEAFNLQVLAAGKGLTAAIRLNGSSDVRWERYGLMESFPSISWYDYTKIPLKNRGRKGELPANYHLTFSMDEDPASWECAYRYLEKSQNVAIVIAASWSTSSKEAKKAAEAVVKRGYIGGFPVISGDDHDARFKDVSGHFIALRAKGLAAHDSAGFVYRADRDGRIANVPRRSMALANRYFPGAAKGHRAPRHSDYYKKREDAKARLVSAKEEFPPGSVVTTKSGARLRVKNWFQVRPGPGGMGVYRVVVLADRIDSYGDVWENVNHLALVQATSA
ncbi:hypothetical protein CMI47_02775 [Candidatus Pacearchaeota archaeon]|nr:hypothetical protein [Candidatus Pacearchaeota archaeon]|tara:strand:+ start:5085 stop:6443 length:1359 start_codon:yes stop_codon:yes gene_type:complete